MVHIVEGEVRPGHFPRDDDTYKRRPTVFRSKLPSAPLAAAAAKGRFHLVVSAACPWAHRALLVRQLKDLGHISLSVVSPLRDDDVGWNFGTAADAAKYGTKALLSPGKDKASGKGLALVSQLYLHADASYTGTVTVPVLYDSTEGTIVSNDSWDIARFLDRAFVPGKKAVVKHPLYPAEDDAKEAERIDEVAKWAQSDLNNAVYMCGLARSQDAYESAQAKVFACLDELETMLARSRFLAGRAEMSVADLQLFPTLARFDDVYHVLFKCSRRRLASYSALSAYVRDIFQTPGVAETIDAQQIKDHYYTTFTSANPNQVVPLGNATAAFSRPHDRADPERFVLPADADAEAAAAAGAEAAGSNSVEEEQGEARKAKLAKGEFVRGVSGHRRIVTKDGAGAGELPAEAGRYHLIVANNCPWCHRVMLARAVLGLEDVVSVDVLFYRRDSDLGWQYLPADAELTPSELRDRAWLLDGKVAKTSSVPFLQQFNYAPEVYAHFGSKEKSVPILFDKQENEIVNNESAEIVRMFAQGFAALHAPGAPELYPAAQAAQVDALNAWIYPQINNGAYKAGFSSGQAAYEAAFASYFEAFDRLEGILEHSRFLAGDAPTEADLRLFPTIARHDPVYYSRMKLCKKMVIDCPALQRWLRDMYALPGVEEATNKDHCIRGYFGRTGNALVPVLAERPARWY